MGGVAAVRRLARVVGRALVGRVGGGGGVSRVSGGGVGSGGLGGLGGFFVVLFALEERE